MRLGINNPISWAFEPDEGWPMRKSTIMLSFCASLAFVGFAAAGPGEVQIAASDDCRKRCQAIENQCRMATKDLDSSKCSAQFLACVQSCRK